MPNDSDLDRAWWERTWIEREDAMWQAFGPSYPPGAREGDVLSFPSSEVPLPSACCYVFPPNRGHRQADRESREYWLYATHGLTQWPNRKVMNAARTANSTASGGGVEFGIISDDESPWAPGLLARIMKIEHSSRTTGARPFERGDRIPFYFESLEPGRTNWVIGGLDAPDSTPADRTRALIFWPYLSRYATFTTETGTFELRIVTMVTAAEWAMAQETSSCHVLLMLGWAGIGQHCRPGRPCITELPGWEEQWAVIGQMPFEETKAALRKIALKERQR
jgi:hypothetical protein